MMNREKNKTKVSEFTKKFRRNPWFFLVLLSISLISVLCFYAQKKISNLDTGGSPILYFLTPEDPNREVLEAKDWKEREIRVEEREDFLLVEVLCPKNSTPFAEGHFRRELSYRSEGMEWKPLGMADYSNAEAMKKDLETLFSLVWKGSLAAALFFAGGVLLRSEWKKWEVGRETDYLGAYVKKHAERLLQSGLAFFILLFLLLWCLLDLKEMSFFHSWASRRLYGFLSPLSETEVNVWENGRLFLTEIHGLGKLFILSVFTMLLFFVGAVGAQKRERKLEKNGGNGDGNGTI